MTRDEALALAAKACTHFMAAELLSAIVKTSRYQFTVDEIEAFILQSPEARRDQR